MSKNIKEFQNQLESEIRKSSKVFIIGPNNLDLDSIGSAIGLYTFTRNLGKKAYIIVDDDLSLETNVRLMIEENKNKFCFINRGVFEQIVDKKSTLLVANTNKQESTLLENDLDKFRSVFVVDNHNENTQSINTSKKFINSTDFSSTSEIVSRLLCNSKGKYGLDTANSLLAGIIQKTHNLTERKSSKTHEVVKRLTEKGASIDYPSALFFNKLQSQLESEIKKSSKVFIVGHNQPDFDSIGSAIGLYTLANHFGKKAYIIVNDEEVTLEPGVKKIMDENRDRFRFITNTDFDFLADKKSLLIATDVNKYERISVGNDLDKVRSVLIIDHHGQGASTIKTDKKFINEGISSASEIVTRILCYYKVKYGAAIANCLLAGINLDTRRFKDNTTSKTHDVAEKLIDKGANLDYVNNLFLEEFETFCRISNLIINGTIIKKYSDSLSPIQVSFTLNRNMPKEIYQKEDCAKAADRMMKFNGIDAAFTLGYVDEENIHISARGNKKVNVGKIMEEMHGGGNPQSAGGRVKSEDIIEVEEELMEKVVAGLSDTEDIIKQPKTIKVKQIRRNKKS